MTYHAHTPKEDWLHTEWIRSSAITGKPMSGTTFDRWLAAHEAEVAAAAEQRGAKAALEDLADNHTVRIPDILGDKVQAVFTETIWEKLDDLEGGE